MNNRENVKSTLECLRCQRVTYVQIAALICWLLSPAFPAHGIYVPDENLSPVWIQLAGETSEGPGANIDDINQNDQADWLDDFSWALATGELTYWQGGTWYIDGVAQSFGGMWHGNTPDADGDGMPDDLDAYPQDGANNSYYWTGGTYLINSIRHSFPASWHSGSGADADFNEIPDDFDDWFINSSAHGTLQYWSGGTYLLNGEYVTFDAISYYAEEYLDNDQDGIPNELDLNPSDIWNGSTFEWGGGSYYLSGVQQNFPPAVYGGAWNDLDSDGIPDVADPFVSDATNNTVWWAGGSYSIDGTMELFPGQYCAAAVGDFDVDGIPDTLDPLPEDPTNTHHYEWVGGVFRINSVDQLVEGGMFSGVWSDSDGDSIPDAADPYPLDQNNGTVTESFYWPGGTYHIDNVDQNIPGQNLAGYWSDDDGDGIPNPLDPYSADSNNGNSFFYWAGGTFIFSHQETTFQPGDYAGTWSDADSDGVPDSADIYPADANNGNNSFYWAGGWFRINNTDQEFSGGYISGNWLDSDSDSIPDQVDPYSLDSNNGNSTESNNTGGDSFYWAGGIFPINNSNQEFFANTYSGYWNDSDGDAIPDVVDPYVNDSNNGNTTFEWSGGSYRIANQDIYLSGGTYPGTFSDSDGDGIPDTHDPYPSDGNNANTTFYWAGGTFRINNQGQYFSSGYYEGSGSDSDSDSLPDILDAYVNDTLNGNQVFYWSGGYFQINDQSIFFAAGNYDGNWLDSDSDGIPDSLDLYALDSNNGNVSVPTYSWSGGYFTINNLSQYFAPGDYPGVWGDSDGDTIPDLLDPYINDSNNGNSPTEPTTFYWAGGNFPINNQTVSFAANSYTGVWGDADSDGIPDTLDPYVNDSNNGNTSTQNFYWSGGSFTINNQSAYFASGDYAGTWIDTDNDGIPDTVDPYVSDPNNGNTSDPTFYWLGGTFPIDNQSIFFSSGSYPGTLNDADNDGIPDSLDPYQYDSGNGNTPTTFYWNGGAFMLSGVEQTYQPGNYDGTWSDNDSDGLPDTLDPYTSDPSNNSLYWPGGTFEIASVSQPIGPAWIAANALDTDSDTIPDPVDPYPDDSTNHAGFTWPEQGQSLVRLIDNISTTFVPVFYVGSFSDRDADLIPDCADPLPDDHFNNNDTDHDLIPDAVESEYESSLALDYNDASDASEVRADGVTNLQAYNYQQQYLEHKNLTLPLDDLFTPGRDTDEDRMPDVYEVKYDLNPFEFRDATACAANDYVMNVEKASHIPPLAANVAVTVEDYFGITGQSLAEVMVSHLSSLTGISNDDTTAESDWDLDGVSNMDEALLQRFGTNPRNAFSRPSLTAIRDRILLRDNRVSQTTINNFGYLTASSIEGGGSGGELDSDLDGIPDSSETLANSLSFDSDGDGIPDGLDADPNDASNTIVLKVGFISPRFNEIVN